MTLGISCAKTQRMRDDSAYRLDSAIIRRLPTVEAVTLEALGRAHELAEAFGVLAEAADDRHVRLRRTSSTGATLVLIVRDNDRPVRPAGALSCALRRAVPPTGTKLRRVSDAEARDAAFQLAQFLELDVALTALTATPRDDTRRAKTGPTPDVMPVRFGRVIVDAAIYRRKVTTVREGQPLLDHEIDVVRLNGRDWPVVLDVDGVMTVR